MSPRTIYLAGGSSEASLVASYIAKVVAAGFRVTLDWTIPVLANGGSDVGLSEADRCAHVMADMIAIRKASIFWLLMPERPSFGAGVELACATGSKGCVAVVSGNWRASIFTSLTDRRFRHHDDALAWLGADAGRT